MKKKLFILSFLALLFCFNPRQAVAERDTNFELFGNLAFVPPATAYGHSFGWGGGFGFGFDLFKISEYVGFTLRSDVGLTWWHGDSFSEVYGGTNDNDILRIILFLGPRVPFAFEALPRWIVFYVEGGLEVCFEHVGVYKKSEIALVAINNTRVKSDKFRFGGALGGGIEFFLTNSFHIGINIRYHLIDSPPLGGLTDHLSLSPTIGFRF